MKMIEVWLYQTSEPIIHEVTSTYTKGPLFCASCLDGKVVKYPVCHLFRVVEGYGTHGGDKVGDAEH